MSTRAASKQVTRDATFTAPSGWTLTTINSNVEALQDFTGAEFVVSGFAPTPDGEVTIKGQARRQPKTGSPAADPQNFSGHYHSGQVVSFNIDQLPFTFFGVYSASTPGLMGGIILSDQAPDNVGGSDDAGSWSSQARPGEPHGSGKPAAKNGRG